MDDAGRRAISIPTVQKAMMKMPKFYMGFAAAILALLAAADQLGLAATSVYKGNYSSATRSTMGQFHK